MYKKEFITNIEDYVNLRACFDYIYSLENSFEKSPDQKKVGDIMFISCTFKGKNEKGCIFPSQSPLSAKTYITMIGCKVENILFSEIPGNSGIAFKLNGGGNRECHITVENFDERIIYLIF